MKKCDVYPYGLSQNPGALDTLSHSWFIVIPAVNMVILGFDTSPYSYVYHI